MATFSHTWFAKAGDYTLVASRRPDAVNQFLQQLYGDTGRPDAHDLQPAAHQHGRRATDLDINVGLLDRLEILSARMTVSAVSLELGRHPASAGFDGTTSADRQRRRGDL